MNNPEIHGDLRETPPQGFPPTLRAKGSVFRDLRLRDQLSQMQLAKKLRTSQASVSRAERDGAIKTELLFASARLFDVSLADIAYIELVAPPEGSKVKVAARLVVRAWMANQMPAELRDIRKFVETEWKNPVFEELALSESEKSLMWYFLQNEGWFSISKDGTVNRAKLCFSVGHSAILRLQCLVDQQLFYSSLSGGLQHPDASFNRPTLKELADEVELRLKYARNCMSSDDFYEALLACDLALCAGDHYLGRLIVDCHLHLRKFLELHREVVESMNYPKTCLKQLRELLLIFREDAVPVMRSYQPYDPECAAWAILRQSEMHFAFVYIAVYKTDSSNAFPGFAEFARNYINQMSNSPRLKSLLEND